MNIYSLLKLYTRIKSRRVKALGLLTLHLLHRRYTCMFLDPVLGCNLRCRMCYFSDSDSRKNLHGVFSPEDLEAWEQAVFPYLLKLQIGCGAEPTLYKSLADIVKAGRAYGVPYISVTTNGNLLTPQWLSSLVDSGLNEITISLHGVCQATYEHFMQGASYAKFVQLIEALKAIKRSCPDFKIRINYTVNEDNVEDLRDFPLLFDGLSLDIVQLRPVQELGNSDYKNFSMAKVLACYDSCVMGVVDYCKDKGITCLYPSRDNIAALASKNTAEKTDHSNHAVDTIPHLYVAPWDGWKKQFDPYQESFYAYCRRTHRVWQLLKYAFGWKPRQTDDRTKSMNYQVNG